MLENLELQVVLVFIFNDFCYLFKIAIAKSCILDKDNTNLVAHT